tara:strand:- start:170 stop:382 length:213 start_codon:yes stop_codon:yes gene_type:complete
MMSEFAESQLIVEYKDPKVMDQLINDISDLIDKKYDGLLYEVRCRDWNQMSGNEFELQGVEREFPLEEDI